MKKWETNVTMLTEEQIQRLAKKAADEHGFDEEEGKGHVHFADNFSEVVHVFLPKPQKSFSKKPLKVNSLKNSFKDVFVSEKRLLKSDG